MSEKTSITDLTEKVLAALSQLKNTVAHRMQRPAASAGDQVLNEQIRDYLDEAILWTAVYTEAPHVYDGMSEAAIEGAKSDLRLFIRANNALDDLSRVMERAMGEKDSLSALFHRLTSRDYTTISKLIDDMDQIYLQSRFGLNKRGDELAAEKAASLPQRVLRLVPQSSAPFHNQALTR